MLPALLPTLLPALPPPACHGRDHVSEEYRRVPFTGLLREAEVFDIFETGDMFCAARSSGSSRVSRFIYIDESGSLDLSYE